VTGMEPLAAAGVTARDASRGGNRDLPAARLDDKHAQHDEIAACGALWPSVRTRGLRHRSRCRAKSTRA
jgi:hypothetical protein